MTICELFRVLNEIQRVRIYKGCLNVYAGQANCIPIGLLDASIKKISTAYNTNIITIELAGESL